MIGLVFEYKQYLREVRGLVEGTCISYPVYLEAITNYLGIDITPETVSSSDAVSRILEKLKHTEIDRNYWRNCQSALRAYLKFLDHVQSSIVVLPSEETEFIEGKCVEVKVNKFERDPRARAVCIGYHKAICKVCGLDFAEMYGEIGQGFIHVHHVIPVSDIRTEYTVDPKKDLVPVCPNCHSMLHTRNPPYSIEELKSKVHSSQNLSC